MRSSQSSSDSTSSSFEQFGETLNRLDQISKSVSNSTGLTQTQVARIALGATGRLGLSTPVLSAQGSTNADKSYASGLSKTEQKALASLTSEQLSDFKQFGDRASQDTGFVRTIASDAREANDLTARLSSTLARSERADASLSERSTYSERISAAYERGDAISIDIAQDPHNLEMFRRYAEHYGGNSASARVLMESELARNAPKPHRVFSDGTAVPTSFSEVADKHRQNGDTKTLSPDFDGRHFENKQEISQNNGRTQPASQNHAQSDVRSTTHAARDRIRATASSDLEPI